jgi:hypothetical protein|tara:strand:+ start:2917 stop:3288 length:372 start_codon:yes stop_codon:yes gene_type:complete
METGCICKKGDEAMWIDGECWECGNKLSNKDWKEIGDEQKLFEISQELRKKISENNEEDIAFANYNCECDEGVAVFDSETRKPLLHISTKNKKGIEELYRELVRKRNKLNRQISTLKKADLKQ